MAHAAFDYSGEQGSDYHSRRRLPPDSEEWIARLRAGKIQPHIRQDDHVLEFGVGFGWNLMALRCAHRAGFDVTPGLRPLVEQRGIQFVSSLEAIQGAGFDAVLAHHALEHVPKPWIALGLMLALLRPGGKLIIFVPYERERKYHSYNREDRSHHLFSWTPASVGRLVSFAGAQVEHISVRRFRFERIAAVLTNKVWQSEWLYRFVHKAALALLPEHETCIIARKRCV
jgi:SAM-dependent methyltransferase